MSKAGRGHAVLVCTGDCEGEEGEGFTVPVGWGGDHSGSKCACSVVYLLKCPEIQKS